MGQRINLADLDCVFLARQEPKKEEFWSKIQCLAPSARRIEVGEKIISLSEIAESSCTQRFLVIDGDSIPDSAFFNTSLDISDIDRDCAFYWRSKNIVNGLHYVDRGISCWSRDHRDPIKITTIPVVRSTTYINQSPRYAWQSGFLAAVQLSLKGGARPSPDEFRVQSFRTSPNELAIWMSVGSDELHGYWAILGARAGCYHSILTDWDPSLVNDPGQLDSLWDQYRDVDIHDEISNLGSLLKRRLGLDILVLGPNESRFFKSHYSRLIP